MTAVPGNARCPCSVPGREGATGEPSWTTRVRTLRSRGSEAPARPAAPACCLYLRRERCQEPLAFLVTLGKSRNDPRPWGQDDGGFLPPSCGPAHTHTLIPAWASRALQGPGVMAELGDEQDSRGRNVWGLNSLPRGPQIRPPSKHTLSIYARLTPKEACTPLKQPAARGVSLVCGWVSFSSGV